MIKAVEGHSNKNGLNSVDWLTMAARAEKKEEKKDATRIQAQATHPRTHAYTQAYRRHVQPHPHPQPHPQNTREHTGLQATYTHIHNHIHTHKLPIQAAAWAVWSTRPWRGRSYQTRAAVIVTVGTGTGSW